MSNADSYIQKLFWNFLLQCNIFFLKISGPFLEIGIFREIGKSHENFIFYKFSTYLLHLRNVFVLNSNLFKKCV